MTSCITLVFVLHIFIPECKAVFCTFRMFIKKSTKIEAKIGLMDVLLRSLKAHKNTIFSRIKRLVLQYTHHLHGHLVPAAGSIVERSESVDVNCERRAPREIPQKMSHRAV